jgi:hypothetical protein
VSYDSTLEELDFFTGQQISEAEALPTIITLVGPIRFWWGRNWGSPDHRRYVEHRENVRLCLATRPNTVVYSPHRAIQGAWHPLLQMINDGAIRISDALVDLTPDWIPDITAEGTEEEIGMAKRLGIPVVRTLGCLTPSWVATMVLTAVN